MKSFEDLDRHFATVPRDIVVQLTAIAEARGRQDVFRNQNPQGLEALKEIALIQSAEASNAIENIHAPRARIEALVADTTQPQNRSEQEIAGYRRALNVVHSNGADMPFDAAIVLQLHGYLGSFTGARDAGSWKGMDNVVENRFPDGSSSVRFQPLSAAETPAAMDALHDAFNRERAVGSTPHLLLTAAYLLDFLTIHPFRDGNGRISRLLTTWMLYLDGMDVARYVSLERVVDETKDSYYESLAASTTGWHAGTHDVLPWTRYFLGVVLDACKRFEDRTEIVSGGHGSKRRLVESFIRDSLKETFTIEDIRDGAPGVSDVYIKKLLGELKNAGVIRREGAGRGSRWRRVGDS